MLVVVSFFSIVIFSEASNQGISKKLKGIFHSDNGLLISDMSEEDKIDISKSFDKNTKEYTKEFNSIGYNYVTEEKFCQNFKEIKFVDDWNTEKVLKLKYVINNMQPILLPVNDEEYYIPFKIPKKSSYILQYNNSLYLLDIEEGVITSLLQDKEEYNKKDLREYDAEGFSAIWGENPSISPNGDRLTYYTNRNFLTNKKKDGEIWFLNMVTGEEYSLGEIGYISIGWGGNENVYYLDYDHNIVKINTTTREKEIIFKKAPIETRMSYPIMLLPRYNSIEIFNLEDNSQATISNNNIGVVSNIILNGDSKALFCNQPDDSEPYTNLILLDIRNKILSCYNIPYKASIENYGWIDDNNIFVSVRESGSIEQYTYILSINDFIILK